MSDALYADAIAAINRYVHIAPDEPVAELFLASVLSCFDPGIEPPRICFVGTHAAALVDLLAGWEPAVLSKRALLNVDMPVGKRILLASGHPDLYAYDPTAHYATLAGCTPTWARGKRGPATLRTLRTPEHPFLFYHWPYRGVTPPSYGRAFAVAHDAVVRLLNERHERLSDFAMNAPLDTLARLDACVKLVSPTALDCSDASVMVACLALLRGTDIVAECDIQAVFRFILSQLGLPESRMMRRLATERPATLTALRNVAMQWQRVDGEAYVVRILSWRAAGVVREIPPRNERRATTWALTERYQALADVAAIAPVPPVMLSGAKADQVLIDDAKGLVV